MRSLSSTVSDTPSTWAPSRNVVSNTSTAVGCSDIFDPILVTVDQAAHDPAVLLHDGLRRRPGARHRPIVDRAHRRDLGGGPTQEDLLGDVQVAAGQVVDANVEAQVLADGHDRALRDAF